MEQFYSWFASLGEPNWDLILKFADVLAWPLVAFVALVTVRPGRLIDAILENGGELSAGPAAIKLERRIDQIGDALRQDPDAQLEAQEAEPVPPADAEDPYSTVMAGWSQIAEKLQEVSGYPINKRDPMSAVSELRRAQKIGNKIQRQLEEMWSVRNQIKRSGSRKTNRALTQARADEYYEAAVRLRKSIGRAIAYRERRASGIGQQGELKLVPAGGRTDGQPVH